jgi:hypothetical protein
VIVNAVRETNFLSRIRTSKDAFKNLNVSEERGEIVPLITAKEALPPLANGTAVNRVVDGIGECERLLR